ncbi:SDR family NAD(P)-dependent oxidoreductase [Micromonospora sp. DT201]|uniref:SDR family NAD(P)-dependent oxidoreductase n=1 Tax=Micromonospora sp. DT201 TaxID=3393442 RepID=UPI003CF39C1A
MSRVVVVVGATSGVGRATARAFAERCDRLALAARAPTTLAEVRAECADVDVLTVPTDVTEAGAVMAYGRFDELPGQVFDQVVRTDLLGTANSVRVSSTGHQPATGGPNHRELCGPAPP